jgi:hypothetical protein
MKTELKNGDGPLWLARLVVLIAVVLRLILLLWAGNANETPLTGGSDTLAYQTLADNIVHLHGMTYASMPTALRAPLYPYFLALVQFAFGHYYLFVARVIQFFAGISVGLVCARASAKLGGLGPVALAAALALPTLIFFSAELLTETFATLLVATFLWFVLERRNPSTIGVVIGLAMITRFNLAALAVVYVAYQISVNRLTLAVRNVSVAGLVAVAIVSPWFVRNLVVFDGQALYSTQAGLNFLQGTVAPDGRIHGADWARLSSRLGYPLQDIEVNTDARLALPSELDLNRIAARAALKELARTNLFRLAADKLSYFWLSFDQVFETQEIQFDKRFVRLAGVFVYWFFLVLGLWGWRKCKEGNPNVARLFVIYAVVITFLHLPFVMSTRIRAPFVEPAIAILVGLAFAPPLPRREEPLAATATVR